VSRPDLTTASLSDVGRVRTRNEDSFGEFSREDGSTLLIVADGMGGHQAGATASHVTVDTAGEVFAASTDPPEDTLRAALEAANARVHEMALEDPALRGMGTTAVALLIGPGDSGFVAHVGDSRLYRYRDEALRPLTRDHSVVAELERRGLLTAEEAAAHPRRNEIMRSIGVNATVDVEIAPVDLRPGDRYLLCSDGLSGLVDETEIAVILEGAAPAEAVRQLVDRANEHGGHDNVTVQIAALATDAPRLPEPSEATAPGATTPRPARDGPARRRKRRTLMAVALLLAALAATLVIWLVHLGIRAGSGAGAGAGDGEGTASALTGAATD
jgi:protein phosphatase